MPTKIDEYFKRKNVKVIYNCLGNTKELIDSYVGEFYKLVDATDSKASQFSKSTIYNRIYEITPREKMTGFESLNKLYTQVRADIIPHLTEPQFTPMLKVEHSQCDSSLNYKDTLLSFVKTIENPLLYLSGGIDSELVARAFLEVGIKFDTVIFEWTDNTGSIINASEVAFAHDFCRQHGIVPVLKQVNVEKLWQSEEFKNLAIEAQIQSPHSVTHVYSIQMMSREFKDVTHVFGGEVRFYTNHLTDKNTYANVIYLDKIFPPSLGYDSGTYSAQVILDTYTNPQVDLFYKNDGTWFITLNPSGTGTPLSGYWTTTPGSSYEFRQQSTLFPSWTSWAPITGAFTLICGVIIYNSGVNAYITDTFTIEVRVIGQTSPVATSTVTFQASVII